MSLLNTDEWMRSVDVPVYAGNGEGAPRPRGVPQTLQFRNGIPFQTVTNRATAHFSLKAFANNPLTGLNQFIVHQLKNQFI